MPATKSRKRLKHPIRAWLHSHKPKTLAGWLWSILAGVITLAGGWTIVRPVLHVDPYVQLDPASPFSERFKVSNDGFFAIYDVDVRCHIIKTVTADGRIVGDVTLVHFGSYRKVIEAATSATIDCPLTSGFIAIPNAKYVSAEIQLIIGFTPSWYPWPKEKTIKFSGQLDSQGSVRWVY